MELHNQIKKFRSALSLSQEELADRIYVTRQTISNCTKGALDGRLENKMYPVKRTPEKDY